MPMAAMMAVPLAVMTGFTPVMRPRATPTSETWASVSAMSEYLRTTMNVPINGATTAIIRPAKTARCMKSY